MLKGIKLCWNNQKEYNNWLKLIENQTIHVKKILNELNINICSLNPFINFNLEGHKKS